jgi:LCP family protein required for cell wall assembly
VLIGLTLPSVYDNRIENDNALPASVQDDIVNSFSMLLMVKNSNNRTDTNIVLTYNGYEKSIKFVSLPRDTYVSINTSKESKRMNDKLLHAYTYGGPETAVNSVSKLLDIPIDYYTVVDIESFTKILDSLSLFIKEKGDSSLSKVDLLTNSKKVDNQQLLNELAKILEETKGNIRLSLLQQNISHLETNFPKEQLRLISRDAEISAIKTLDLSEGIIGVEINNIYYEKLDSTLLERVSTELKFHLENK